MNQPGFQFVDRTGFSETSITVNRPVVIPQEAIEAEIERLAQLPAPRNGRRVSLICNPATGVGLGLAPGIAVALAVLQPGERTAPLRHNSSLVNFCIKGAGHTLIAGRRIDYTQYDVWNTPPWAVYQYVNDTNALQVRLIYSNSALLEKMNIHVVEENPTLDRNAPSPRTQTAKAVNPFGTFPINEAGACLMPYEKLISPDVISMEALHWPWKQVKTELDKLMALGPSYIGRRLYLLYHPATGRTNGTTYNFFATMCVRPGNIVDRPHRHTAAAINYFFAGRGYSIIEGEKYYWKAGDLMLTAPGWAIHNHASYEDDVYELTIQDSPLHIGMGSLLWQESLQRPAEVLGLSGGFATNRPL